MSDEFAVNSPSRLVTFAPLGITAAALANESVLDVARRAGAPLGNSCGGVGVCTRCKVRVVEGSEALSAPTSIELRFGAANRFAAGERMACQAVVTGDCTVTTTYW
ncbi:MAG: (2Fe-2S)-binding protein [Acidobacteria bacterium]|nr:(2Fe-2S)-binding protein [Acidobacteriota bacterium]MBV9477111.1 (2Fe-2S)-binding protein [Acidobacteriota bacterium]